MVQALEQLVSDLKERKRFGKVSAKFLIIHFISPSFKDIYNGLTC